MNGVRSKFYAKSWGIKYGFMTSLIGNSPVFPKRKLHVIGPTLSCRIGSQRVMMIAVLFLLFFSAPLRGQTCDLQSLLDTGRAMSTYMCHVYNDSHLDKLNGFILAPNATVTVQDYDFIAGTCGPYQSLPMNVYFVLVFANFHSCSAAIPVYSSKGTDSLVKVTGYAELMVETQSKVKEVTFVWSQTDAGCVMQLTAMTMRDVQCAGYQEPTSSTTITTTGGSSGGSSGSGSSSSTSPTTTYTVSSPYYDGDRYTAISPTIDGANSFNNPALHKDVKECGVKFGKFRLVMVKSSYRFAPVACIRKGYRMASIAKDELGAAIGLVSACLGANQSAWIGEYWARSQRPNQCLEVTSGASSRAGGIQLASSCGKLQAVLCEDPYFDAGLIQKHLYSRPA